MNEHNGQNNPGCLHYTIYGCVGTVLLSVIACVALVIWIRYTLTSALNTALSPNPIKRTSPYHFLDRRGSAQVSIPLPNGQGTLVYAHCFNKQLPRYGNPGERALELISFSHPIQEWPLSYYCPPANIRVGVYWYPARNGKGPFIVLYDAGGYSVLDLKRREIGEIVKSAGRVYMADYAYNNYEFQSGSSSINNKIISATGKPAGDITSVIIPSNRMYLGSIIQSGNKLIFKPVNVKP